MMGTILFIGVPALLALAALFGLALWLDRRDVREPYDEPDNWGRW